MNRDEFGILHPSSRYCCSSAWPGKWPDRRGLPPNPYEDPRGQETNVPEERIVAFLPLFRIGHRWHPVTRPDFSARCRCSERATAPHTSCGAIAVETTIAGLLRVPCDLDT